ncbi:MAG TPA: efflux transporter outer membrane subunit [Polyangiaceae bacterium]|nr:efflux transporter outer membrane subunit [Polyangiaceae bacterium]
MRGSISWICSSLTAASLFGCNVGPNYERPVVSTPPAYRSAAPAAPVTAPAEVSIAEQPFAQVFTDPALQQLIGVALTSNYDALIAANRVLAAEAELGIVRSAQLPVVSANAGAQAGRARLGGRGEPVTGGLFALGASVSWEIDFWGKFRRGTEAARARLLASEWGRRALLTSLVSQVAALYYELRGLDEQLDIARRTLASRQESLRLTQVRDAGGAGSLVDVRQAEQLVFGASAQIVDLERRIALQENGLSTLLGRDPGPIPRGLAISAQPRALDVPTGLPSSLLERRPDIRQAEQQLVASNAQIGVAKSAYFPQITLTGSGGVASAALSTLFSAPALVWSAAASLAQPVFNGGRLAAQVDAAELGKEAALLAYRQTIQQAFREVSDALISYQRGRDFRQVQEDLLGSAREARRLAELRYQGGATSYLEVLDSDTRLFIAELGLVGAELSELSAYVEIYRALGGGFQG